MSPLDNSINRATGASLIGRIESAINSYLTERVEVAPGVFFNQYQLISRLYKFKNRDLTGEKLNPDLSYNYYFDIISPRADAEVKNLRIDTKNILIFSQDPQKDFAATFLANASLKQWMSDCGEGIKLKEAVEEYSDNGNIGFKRVKGGYEAIDPLNTFITNIRARTVDDTDIIERYEMTASQIKQMEVWDQEVADDVIANLGDKEFQATELSSPNASTNKRYEIYEFTGEVSEEEYNEVAGIGEKGSKNVFFLAKIVLAGLRKDGTGERYCLFSDKIKGKMSDHYLYAHRGKYKGRFWREGIYELLFDHQIRANEIGNQLATGLEWASRVIFKSSDSKILQNVRADLDNGDIIITNDLSQVDVRLHNVDQLIADWNRLIADADRIANSMEVVRGENLPSGTPFRMAMLLDENAGKLFILLRQKITLVYKSVFKDWILPDLVKDMKGKDVFQFTGDAEILDKLREIVVDSWYADNLVKIGPHSKEQAKALKQEKLDEMRRVDPGVKNSKKIWENVLPRLMVTITGENSTMGDQIQDLLALMQMETDPARVEWILDTIYAIRGIPVPPRSTQGTPDPMNPEQMSGEQTPDEQVIDPAQMAGAAQEL